MTKLGLIDGGAMALRPREAAKALGVSERTLWAWTKEGRVPHVKMDRAVLYPIDALRQWLTSETSSPKTGGVQ